MNVLVLSGGGQAGWDMLGAINHIQEEIPSFDAYVGTSVGGIIATLCSVGFHAVELFETLQHVDISNKPSLVRCVEEFGLCDSQPLVNSVTKLLEDKCGPEPTFKTHHERFGVDLVITGVCVTTQQTEYFRWDTHPDMKLMDAIRITCAVPILFVPVKHDDRLYVDGALGDNFPIEYALRTYKDTAKRVVGVTVQPARMQPTCFFTYVVNVLRFLIDRHQSLTAKVTTADDNCTVTVVPLEQAVSRMFDLFRNVENKRVMFDHGKETAQKHLKPLPIVNE
jgi:predicted acylesterase/phospholipase RssA